MSKTNEDVNLKKLRVKELPYSKFGGIPINRF
jgi:hypothetical protein